MESWEIPANKIESIADFTVRKLDTLDVKRLLNGGGGGTKTFKKSKKMQYKIATGLTRTDNNCVATIDKL